MSRSNKLITHDELVSLLNYDSETGIFTWKDGGRNRKPGCAAGSRHHTGYVQITILRLNYLAHRLAWFFVKKAWPEGEIDHINGVHADNRISNLRDSSRAQNQRNVGLISTNKSGVKGVSWSAKERKWKCGMIYDGKAYCLGTYDDIELAELVAMEAREKLHGEFCNHGRAAQ